MTAKTDRPSAAVRIRVYKRDRFMCTYCGTPGTDAELEVDHIIALANGGSNHMSNLTTCCRKCNQLKGTGTLKPTARAGVKARETHPLEGLFLHTLKDGKFNWQGHIVGVDGDVCLVQLFSWMFGEPTEIVKMQKSVIYSDSVVLYASKERWAYAAEMAQKRDEQRMRNAVNAERARGAVN